MNVVFDKARIEEKAFASLMRDLSLSLKVLLSKKRRLVAELEARVERGDPTRPLEHMREIVARDYEFLGELERLLPRAQVGVGLKDGYVTDMKELEYVRAEFIEEFDSLGVYPVPAKLTEFLKQIQRKN
ncbi:hypothetical protein Tco_0484291 [Tanacetum coccineum]